MMRLTLGALFSSASRPFRSLRTLGLALTTVATVAAPSFATDEATTAEKRHYGSISTNALLVGNMTLAGSQSDYARGGMSTTGMSSSSLTAVHDRMALCDDLDGPACRSVDSISAAITHIDSIEMNEHVTRLELMLNSMRGHQNSLKVAREELLDAKGLVKSLQSVQRSLQERITILNAEITELQTVDAKRRVMNDDLTYRNRMLVQERDNAVARVRELESAVISLRSSMDERSSEAAMLSQQLDHRSNELKGTLDTLKELKADNESRISLYRGARQELEEAKSQIIALEQKIEMMSIQIAEFERSNAALALQLEEARAVIDQLRGELVQRDGHIAQLKMELAAEKDLHLQTTRSLQDLTASYEQSEAARVSLAQALSAKQVELDETIMACEATRRDLDFTKADLNSTKRALEECQAKSTELEALVVELETEIAALRASLTTAQAEILGYENRISDLEALLVERDQTIIALKSLIENVKDENAALKLALETAEAGKLEAIAERDTAVEAEAAITLQLETAGQTIVYLEGELAKLREQLAALEAENQELRKFEYLAQGQEAKIGYLESENQDLRSKLQAALTQLTVVSDERDVALADLNQKITVIVNERDTAVSGLNGLRLELDQSRALYEGRIKDLTKERKAQNKTLHALKDRVYILGNLEQDKLALERKVLSLTAHVDDLSEELAASQATEAEASADAARLKIERDQALAEVDSLNLRIQDLLMQINGQTELTQRQRKEIILLRREIAELRAKGSEIDIHVSLVEQLKQKHADLQVELENLQAAPVVVQTEASIEATETPAIDVETTDDMAYYLMDQTVHHHHHDQSLEGCALASCGTSPDQQQAKILAMSQVLADIIKELDEDEVKTAPLPVVISKLVQDNKRLSREKQDVEVNHIEIINRHEQKFAKLYGDFQAAKSEHRDQVSIYITELEGKEETIKQLELKIARMHDQLVDLQEQADVHGAAMAEKISIIDGLQGQLDQIMADLDTERARVTELEFLIQSLRVKNEESQARILMLQQTIDDLKADHKANLADLEAEIAALIAERDGLAQQLNTVSVERNDFELVNRQLIERIRILEAALADLEAKRDAKADDLRRQIEICINERDALKRDLEQSSSRIIVLQEEAKQKDAGTAILRDQITVLNLRIEELKGDIAQEEQAKDDLIIEFESKLATKNDEIDRLTLIIADLRAHLADARSDLEGREIVDSKLLAQIKILENRLAVKQDEIDALLRETGDQRTIIVTQESEIERLAAEIERLKASIENYKDMLDQHHGEIARAVETEKAVAAEKEAEINRLTLILNGKSDDSAQMQKQIDSKLIIIRDLENQLAGRDTQITTMNLIITELQEKLQSQGSDFDVVKITLEEELAKILEELARVQEAHATDTSLLSEQLARAMAQIEERDHHIKDQHVKIRALERRIIVIEEAADKRIADYEATIAPLRLRLLNVVTAYKAQQPEAGDTEIKWMSNAVSSLEEAAAELEDMQRKAAGNASIEIKALKEELAEKNQTLANLTVKLKRVRGMEEANQTLLGQIKDMEAEIARLNLIISQKDRLIADLNGDVDRMSTESDILKLDIKSLKSELARKDRLIAQLQSDIRSLSAELEEKGQSQPLINNLKSRIAVLVNEKAALETELLSVRRLLEKSERKLGQKIKEINALEREVSTLKAKLRDYDSKIGEIDRLNRTVAKLRAEIADLKFKLSQSQTDIMGNEVLKSRLKDAQKKIKELQAALTKAEQEVRKSGLDSVPRSAFEALQRDFSELQVELQSCGAKLEACVTQLSRARETMMIQEERIAELQYKLMNMPEPQAVVACANGTRVIDDGTGNPCAETSKMFDLIAMRDTFHADLAERLGTKKSFGSNFSAAIDFEPASPLIAASEEEDLDAIADAIKALGASEVGDRAWFVRVEGHADNDQISGAICYPRASLGQDTCIANNRELSMERAYNVVRALIERGVSEQRLSLSGFSDAHPITYVRGSNPSGLSDRRIEFTLDLWR